MTHTKPNNMADQKKDILIWAHSDQVGGTVLASVLASALRRMVGGRRPLGILTPFPGAVKDFFKYEAAREIGIETIPVPMGIKLVKDSTTGRVSPMATLDLIKKLSKTPISDQVDAYIKLLEPKIHKKTLVISCGEPFALKEAKNLGLKAITVTDHLITHSVKHVLNKAGVFFEMDVGNYLNELQSFDLLGEESFLSPPEFGVPEYKNYLSQGARKCLEIGGLFYDPIPIPEINAAPHYKELSSINSTSPVVIVFGGGGSVWDGIYLELYKAAVEGKPREFALIIRDVQDNKVKPRTWRLFEPGDTTGRLLDDPGKMMYWYAASALLVGRGGLAAQQILATMISDIADYSIPGMLFVEEPGHPQIESERLMLGSMGLVFSCCLEEFKKAPFKNINNILSKKELLKSIRDRARLRYSLEVPDRLAEYIWNYLT